MVELTSPTRLEHDLIGQRSIPAVTFSALLGPVFGMLFRKVSRRSSLSPLQRYQETFESLLYGVVLAVILALFLKEAGPSARNKTQFATEDK